jgi:hypothetical protein
MSINAILIRSRAEQAPDANRRFVGKVERVSPTWLEPYWPRVLHKVWLIYDHSHLHPYHRQCTARHPLRVQHHADHKDQRQKHDDDFGIEIAFGLIVFHRDHFKWSPLSFQYKLFFSCSSQKRST